MKGEGLISCDSKQEQKELNIIKELVSVVKANLSMSCLFSITGNVYKHKRNKEYLRAENWHIWRMRSLKFGIFEKYT